MHIFFVRADNDLDHLAPVMYTLLNRGDKVLMVSRDPIRNLKEDFRTKYLRENESFTYLDLINDTVSGYFKLQRLVFLSFYWKLNYIKPQKTRFGQKLVKFLLAVLLRKLFVLRNRIEENVVLENFFDKHQAVTVSFDHDLDSFTRGCIAYFKMRLATTISLPHSIPHIDSYRFGDKFHVNSSAYSKHDEFLNEFDHVVVPNKKIEERFIHAGVDSDKIAVLGAPRFSHGWCNRLREMQYDRSSVFKTQKKKVLLLASKIQPHIFKSEIFAIVESIIEDGRFELVIKPHTRNGISGFPKEITSRAYMANQEPSVDLIEQADLTLFWSTSFIYDPLVLGKPLVFLKYVYSLPFDFEEYVDCWSIGHREQFSDFMNNFALQNDTYKRFIDAYESQRASCIRELVMGGNDDIESGINQFFSLPELPTHE